MVKAIKKIIKFIFNKSEIDCVDCMFGTSADNAFPCCKCDNRKYFLSKYEFYGVDKN